MEDCIGWVTIMERCDSNLRKMLKVDKYSLSERKKIALGIRNGDKYLGQIGIKHMDMKPENILLKNGIAKIIDFGIAEININR